MKKLLALLLALCMSLSLGAGALAEGEEDGTIWFATEDGQTKFTSETPAAVTMTATAPQDGTYLITTMPKGPDGGKEGFSVTSEDQALAFLAEQEPQDLWDGGYWTVELTAGDYAVTAENVTSMRMSLFLVDDTGMPDDIPPAAERVSARFWFTEDGKRTSRFRAEEPASAAMTATVEQDGLYLVTVDAEGSEALSLTVDGDAFAFMGQLQPAASDDGEAYQIRKTALVELTAGEYTLQIENGTSCSVDVELTHPLDGVDGVIGEGLYVCQLGEAATVSYTVMGVGAEADFYAGPADSLSEAGSVWAHKKNSDQAVVTFEPGPVVIDFEGGYVTSALVGASEGAHAALSAETIAFDVDPLNMDENGAVLGTVSVPADGYYLFAASLSSMNEAAEFTFSTDLPIQTDGAAIAFDALPTGVLRKNIGAAVELAAGDYTVAVGSAYYDAKLIPPQTVDSLEGSFAPGSAYVCTLAEPVTVSFTMDAIDAKEAHFFGGATGALLQDLSPALDAQAGQNVTFAVDFPAGIAVIDASSDFITGPVTGTVS